MVGRLTEEARKNSRPPIKKANLCGVIVLNWKEFEYTLACCKSIISSDYKNLLLIVVDNSSPDDSYYRLKKSFSSLGHTVRIGDFESEYLVNRSYYNMTVFLLKTKENLGYAGGNNVGIKKAYGAGSSHILILNNDVVIDKSAISLMMKKAIPDPRIGIVGACICDYKRRATVQAMGGGRFYPWICHTTLQGENLSTEAAKRTALAGRNEIPKVDYISGACMLIKRGLIESVGLLREDFFLYFEEIDFCRRAQMKGWLFGIAEKAMVYHSSLKDNKTRRVRANYYYTRNGMYIIAQYFPMAFPVAFLVTCTRIFALVLRGRRQEALSIVKGLGDFVLRKKGK